MLNKNTKMCKIIRGGRIQSWGSYPRASKSKPTGLQVTMPKEMEAINFFLLSKTQQCYHNVKWPTVHGAVSQYRINKTEVSSLLNL